MPFPKHSLLKAMSIKSLAIYTISLTLGIGAVTNAKALTIEQAPQPQEAAQIAKSYRHPMRPSFPHMGRESQGLVATGGWAFTELGN